MHESADPDIDCGAAQDGSQMTVEPSQSALEADFLVTASVRYALESSFRSTLDVACVFVRAGSAQFEQLAQQNLRLLLLIFALAQAP